MIRINRPSCPNLSGLKRNYKHPDNKEVLKQASYEKCMYCESKVTSVYYGDIEHIKPKSKYPQLEFEWDNLGYVCAICNDKKGDIYDDTLPFINPYEENPCDFLYALGCYITHMSGNKRGEITVKAIKLNRQELIIKRLERIENLKTLIDRYAQESNSTLKEILLEQIRLECKEDKEFSLCNTSLAKAEGII